VSRRSDLAAWDAYVAAGMDKPMPAGLVFWTATGPVPVDRDGRLTAYPERRVVVAVRCRRRGHELGKYVAGADGQRHMFLRHRADVEPDFGDEPAHDYGESDFATCLCARPHLVTRRALEAAEAAGKRVMVVGPVR
jgi:hypothetical protein